MTEQKKKPLKTKLPKPIALARLPQESKKETFTLPTTLIEDIEAYREFQCSMVDSDKVTRDLALQAALEAIFRMDKAFQAWKKTRNSLK